MLHRQFSNPLFGRLDSLLKDTSVNDEDELKFLEVNTDTGKIC